MKLSRPTASKPTPWLSATALTSLLCLNGSAALGEEVQQRVYECRQGGQVIFSDQPCGAGERQLNLEFNQPSRAQESEAAATAQEEESIANQAGQANLLDTEILGAQQKVSRLQTERDATVAELRAQRDAGSENLDQAAWVAEMNAKIEATYQDYTNEIIDARSHLNMLRAQRATLSNPSDSGAQ
jgi:hypothetical protein